MVHSVRTWSVQVKLRDPLRIHALGVFTMRCYTNAHLPLHAAFTAGKYNSPGDYGLSTLAKPL